MVAETSNLSFNQFVPSMRAEVSSRKDNESSDNKNVALIESSSMASKAKIRTNPLEYFKNIEGTMASCVESIDTMQISFGLNFLKSVVVVVEDY